MKRLVEAGGLTGVTTGTRRFDSYGYCITVTIDLQIYNSLGVPRGLALVPELVTRTAPKPGLAAFDRSTETLAVHVSEHQHLHRLSVLNYCRNQSATIKFHCIECDIHLSKIPCSRRYCFTSLILYSPK